MKNFNLTLGIVEPLKIQPFEIVSQDLNGNKLNINLVIDGSLIPYNLTGTTVILYFKRDDGVRLQQYATITNAIQGQIEIVLDTDIIATRGKVFAEVAVYVEEEMKCTSQLFGFQVRKNINDSETVVSGNDLPNYRQEMQRLETILDNLILSAGDSNPEIVAARYSMLENKTFTTLGNRLDFIEEKARQNVTDLETSITAVADDLAAHKEESASDDVHGIKTYADTKVSRTGDVLSGNLFFSQSNSAIVKADNAGRNFIAGGTSLTVANGAYLGLEGIDYGEVGQGGNVYISVPPGRRLFISNGYLTLFSSTDIRVGFNSPEGVISANVGSLYLRTNGEANTTLYVKESGTGNVGWVAK